MKVKTILKINKLVREEKIVEIGANPFLKDTKIPVNIVKSKNKYKKQNDVLVPLEAVLEKTPFAKLYITSENRILFNRIPANAKSVFMWMIFEINQGDDFVQVNRERCMKELSIKAVATYSNAIKKLIRYGMIKQTKAFDTYWINSEFVFFGSRIKKYPQRLDKVYIEEDDQEYPSNDNEKLNLLRPQ